MGWTWIQAMCLAVGTGGAIAAGPGDIAWVQAPAPDDLLAQAEALDDGAVRAIVDRAYAAVGCALPSDLVTVFDIYLVDQAMTSLGVPIGPEVARDGVFALRLRSTTIHHPEARAILSVVRALHGRVAADVRAGHLRMRHGLFEVRDCVPEGTLFALSLYAGQSNRDRAPAP
ncbi:hypothetical protein [Gymnodinialimonas ulvae]|uniref:hypothetical protein n=1 Tax=Gymnodinialimonas ulvae TaxID=3126504 RepID=UPI0030B425A8